MNPSQQEFRPQEHRPPSEQEIAPIPRTVARAFGGWFRQHLSKPLRDIRSALEDPNAGADQNPTIAIFIKTMREKFPEIQEITTGLYEAKVVRLQRTEAGNDSFFFSGTDRAPLPAGEYLLDAPFQERFTNALSHNIGTPNSALVGFSELIEYRYLDSSASPSAMVINEQARRINDLLKPIITIDAKKVQVKITVSENETVDVSLIPRPEAED